MRICQDSFQDTSTPTRIIWIKTDIDTVGICQPNYIAARCDWPPVNFTTSVFLQVLVKSVAINIFINLCPGHRLSNPVLEVEGRCANLAPRLPQAQQAIAPFRMVTRGLLSPSGCNPLLWDILIIPVEGAGPVDLWKTLIAQFEPLLPLLAKGREALDASTVLPVLPALGARVL